MQIIRRVFVACLLVHDIVARRTTRKRYGGRSYPSRASVNEDLCPFGIAAEGYRLRRAMHDRRASRYNQPGRQHHAQNGFVHSTIPRLRKPATQVISALELAIDLSP